MNQSEKWFDKFMLQERPPLRDIIIAALVTAQIIEWIQEYFNKG